MNVVRAISNEGSGRIKYYTQMRGLLERIRRYSAISRATPPRFRSSYLDKLRRNLGPFHQYLPAGALYHDPNAYLKSVGAPNG